MNVRKAADRLKAQFEENPVLVIGVLSGAVLATAKLIDAGVNARNSSTWKQEVARRERKSR